MFGRSNNITLAPAKNTFLHRHLHRNLHDKTGRRYGITNTLSGKHCIPHLHRQYSGSMGTVHMPGDRGGNREHGFVGTGRHRSSSVAIATQVINPSAIGQRGPARLVTGFTGRATTTVDDDEDNLLGTGSGGRRICGRGRGCSWSKLGCYGGTIVASILVLTIVVLAVGYMQMEKERVFSSRSSQSRAFAQRYPLAYQNGQGRHGHAGNICKPCEVGKPATTTGIDSPEIGSNELGEDDDGPRRADEDEAAAWLQEPHSEGAPDRDDDVGKSGSGEEGVSTPGAVFESNWTTIVPLDHHHLSGPIHTAADKEQGQGNNNDLFSNDNSDHLNQEQEEHANLHGLHQDNNGPNELHQANQEEAGIISDSGSSMRPALIDEDDNDEGFTLTPHPHSDSLPSEVKVLPPKDFRPDYNEMGTEEDQLRLLQGEQISNDNHNGNDENVNNNGLSFSIPIYATMSNNNNGPSSLNFDSASTYTVTGAIPIPITTVASPSTASSSSSSSSTSSSSSLSMTTASAVDLAGQILHSFTFPSSSSTFPTPTELSYVTATATDSSPSSHITPKLKLKLTAEPQPGLHLGEAKLHLQTDLFDDESSSEDATVTVPAPNHHEGRFHGGDSPRLQYQTRVGVYEKGHQHGHHHSNGTGSSAANPNSRIVTVHGKTGYKDRPPPPPKIRVQDRTYTPRPNSIVPPSPDRWPKYTTTPPPSPSHFTQKTVSTSSSFSKLYDFQDALSTTTSTPNQNPNHNYNYGYNSKVEYINVEPNPPASTPAPATPNPLSFIVPVTTSATATINTSPYQPNPYLLDFNQVHAQTQQQSNPSSTPTFHDQSHSHVTFDTSQTGRLLLPMNTFVFTPSPNPGVAAPASQTKDLDFGFATNAHLAAAVSGFDNFDFSKFLTQRPDPTPANNYNAGVFTASPAGVGGAGSDGYSQQLLSKRTFYASAPATATAASSSIPLTNYLGTVTSTGAGLGLNHYNNNNLNLLSSVPAQEDHHLPSGSVPIDLASSYIPASVGGLGHGHFGPGGPAESRFNLNHVGHNGVGGAGITLAGINYNDPTAALSRYLPAHQATGTIDSTGNYNTITQGIHLLSLLSGNIPQHLLPDTPSSASHIQGRSLDLTFPIDQLGSFSQNIARRVLPNAKPSPVPAPALAAGKSPKGTATTAAMDILGGLINKVKQAVSSSSTSEDIHLGNEAEAADSSTSLVKKASAMLETPRKRNSAAIPTRFSLGKFDKGLKAGFFSFST